MQWVRRAGTEGVGLDSTSKRTSSFNGDLPFLGRLLAIVVSSAVGLWKLFRDQAERGSGIGPKTVQLHRGNGVHHHPGILFGFTPDWRSESSRNRVHLRPDSSITSALCVKEVPAPGLRNVMLEELQRRNFSSETG
jgi:hypothetical protein